MNKILFWIRDIMIPHGQTRKEIFRDMSITGALLGAAALFCGMLNAMGNSDNAVPMVFVLAVLLTAHSSRALPWSYPLTAPSGLLTLSIFSVG